MSVSMSVLSVLSALLSLLSLSLSLSFAPVLVRSRSRPMQHLSQEIVLLDSATL